MFSVIFYTAEKSYQYEVICRDSIANDETFTICTDKHKDCSGVTLHLTHQKWVFLKMLTNFFIAVEIVESIENIWNKNN